MLSAPVSKVHCLPIVDRLRIHIHGLRCCGWRIQALCNIVIVIIIEKAGTVENTGKILSIEDVDMLQWGPVGYSMSISEVGQRGAEEVKATERRVFETVIAMSVPFQAEISSVDQAKYYLDLGGKHFCIGTDIFIL